jgi:hypothetical protein
LTQGPLSQGGFLSQHGLSQTGLSQPEFSQDLLDHYQSQAEGLLSQDSTYQTDPSYFANSQLTNRNMSQIGNNNNNNGSSGGQLSQF